MAGVHSICEGGRTKTTCHRDSEGMVSAPLFLPFPAALDNVLISEISAEKVSMHLVLGGCLDVPPCTRTDPGNFGA